MATTWQGSLDAQGLRVAVVVSRFNEAITERLLQGAEDCLERHGCDADRRTVVKVPGAFEIAQAARRLSRSDRFDAIVALGAVIRGETTHYDLLASDVTGALSRVALESGIPVAFGVLTCENVDQALARSGPESGNKGWEAARSAVEMANLFRHMDEA